MSQPVIVTGIDGSAESKEALRWAVAEARVHGDEVVALHAYDVEIPSPDAAPGPPLDVVGPVFEIHEGAVDLVTKVVDEVVGDDSAVTVTPTAVEDYPAKALIDAAHGADLLVVAAKGEGLSSLLGSVSLECAHHSPCPVVIYRRDRA